MAVTVGTDSYVTAAEYIQFVADYFNTNLIASGNALDTPLIDSHLRQAAILVDNYASVRGTTWAGAKVSATQSLEFPRTGMTIVPDEVRRAQMFYANDIREGVISLNTSADAHTQRTSVLSKEVALPGGVRIRPQQGQQTIITRHATDEADTSIIAGLLGKYLLGADTFLSSVEYAPQ